MLNAGPADDVTFDSPSGAFEVALDVVSFALEAVFEAASVAFEVVEACRTAERRAIRCECRSIVRSEFDEDLNVVLLYQTKHNVRKNHL